jgi:hypothetical protein
MKASQFMAFCDGRGSMMTRWEVLTRRIEEQQHIQMTNPPSSKEWQDASKEIHRLAEILTGKKPQEAKG